MRVVGTILRHVVVWPWTGDFSESWADVDDVSPDHPAHDSFLRIMRRVSEAYSQAVIPCRIPNVTSELRLVVRGVSDDDRLTVSALEWPKPDPSSFEIVDVVLPVSFAEATGQSRAETGLAVIAAATTSLAGVRGWPTNLLEQARQVIVDSGIRCEHVTSWKASPGRRFKARLVTWLHDDGFARARLEVADRFEHLVCSSEDQVTWANMIKDMRGFKNNLRWTDALTVTFERPLGYGSSLSISATPRPPRGRSLEPDVTSSLRRHRPRSGRCRSP